MWATLGETWGGRPQTLWWEPSKPTLANLSKKTKQQQQQKKTPNVLEMYLLTFGLKKSSGELILGNEQ